MKRFVSRKLQQNYPSFATEVFVSNWKYIENFINLVNEKYGIQKRWRAEEGEYYYYISLDLGIIKTKSYSNDDFDNERYNLGNYFQTEAEAKRVKIESDKVWEKVRNGEIGE